MPDQVPNVPTTPIAGQSPQQALNDQQWQAHKLRQLLDKEQEDMQKKANQPIRRARYSSIQKGALVSFQYIKLPDGLGWHHDPYPLVLCSSIYNDGKVAGVNLHYMTFKYIRYLIKTYCGKQFHYAQIKGNKYIYNSFRTYRPEGLRMTRILDCDYLANILGQVRSFNPNEVEAIRKFVQEQLRRKTNPTAEDLAKEFSSIVHNNPKHERYRDYNLPKQYGFAPPYWKPTRGHGSKLPNTEFPGGTNLNLPGGGTI